MHWGTVVAGAGVEFAWIVDDRNRANVITTNMAGQSSHHSCTRSATLDCSPFTMRCQHQGRPTARCVCALLITSLPCLVWCVLLLSPGIRNSLIISRTEAGKQGTAGVWPSGRGVRGLLTQSPPPGHAKHSSLLSAVNVTFVNFTLAAEQGQFRALEHCAKCKTFQGGGTTFTQGLKFIQEGLPALADWSWGHQGGCRWQCQQPAGAASLTHLEWNRHIKGWAG